MRPAERFAWETVRNHETLGEFTTDENSDWALSPSTRLYLWEMLERNQPTRILEFGSGQSTILFAAYASQMAKVDVNVQVCSVEHDRQWFDVLQQKLDALQLSRFVTLVDAPLASQCLAGREMTAYAVPESTLHDVAGQSGFDVCLIDGPPGKIGRVGSLCIAVPYLADGAEILLDDSFRQGEQAVVLEWQKLWPDRLSTAEILMADEHGIARMRWHGVPMKTGATV